MLRSGGSCILSGICSFLCCCAAYIDEEDGVRRFFQESALSHMRCGGARARGKMAHEESERRQSPLAQALCGERAEQTPPACVLTPLLFSWRRKSNGLLHNRIAYLRFLSQGERWIVGPDRVSLWGEQPFPC